MLHACDQVKIFLTEAGGAELTAINLREEPGWRPLLFLLWKSLDVYVVTFALLQQMHAYMHACNTIPEPWVYCIVGLCEYIAVCLNVSVCRESAHPKCFVYSMDILNITV